jgi:tRNA threonylcarbamoyladenosine biosynthesis protein TsaB
MLLAVDTSTLWVGLALYDGERVISEETWLSQNHHSVELAPALSSLIKRSGVSARSLSALAVALGPGSFTSLRIGLAFVKGLALALHLPIIGVPTLDILAVAQPVREQPLVAVLQAGRGRLVLGWYRSQSNHWQPSSEPEISTAEELAQSIRKQTLVCGELSGEERQLLARKRKNVILASPAQSLRRPAFLAEIAWERWQAGQVDEPISLAPIYLHVAEPIPV